MGINYKFWKSHPFQIYKYLGNGSLFQRNNYIDKKPNGTYIDNPIYNRLKDCDISCNYMKELFLINNYK